MSDRSTPLLDEYAWVPAAHRPEPKQTHLAVPWNGMWGPRCASEAGWVVPLIPKACGRNLVDCQRCLDLWGHDEALLRDTAWRPTPVSANITG